MKNLLLLIPFGMLLFFSTSCNKDVVAYEDIVGKWTIDEATALGFTIQGDGSYMEFNACTTPPCSGVDFEASSSTSGSFTYEFDATETMLTIVDNDTAGGSYGGVWTIDLEKKDMTLTQNTLFGAISFKLSK